jgi:cyclic pyranopterin phosphate synthase
VEFIERIGALLTTVKLDELTLTTIGTLLARHASGVVEAGVRRINVSLDATTFSRTG